MPLGHRTATGLVWHAMTFPWRFTRRQIDRWKRGHVYGVRQPAWWPAWLGEWPGIRSPHDGKSIVIFDGDRRYEFAPVVYGRYRGHVYDGTYWPDARDVAARLERLGLPADAAPVLAIVSGFKGGYDSIQTYGRGKFCWGFIQFAANGGLPRLLDGIKRGWPEIFRSCFSDAGIDVRGGALVLRWNGRTLTGRRIAERLHDEPELWTTFLRASGREEVRDAQVQAAYAAFYAHPLTIPVRLGGRDVPLGELFERHRFARAFICDRAVHRGVGHVARLFRKAASRARAASAADADAILACARALESADAVRLRTLEEKVKASTA